MSALPQPTTTVYKERSEKKKKKEKKRKKKGVQDKFLKVKKRSDTNAGPTTANHPKPEKPNPPRYRENC